MGNKTSSLHEDQIFSDEEIVSVSSGDSGVKSQTKVKLPSAKSSKKSKKNRDRNYSRSVTATSSVSSTSSGTKQNDESSIPTTETKGNFLWMTTKRGLKDDMLRYDNSDITRLQILHAVVKCVYNDIYQAPVTEVLTEGGMVLDIGCAFGVWAQEMALKFPNSTIIGLDAVELFNKTQSKHPPNCVFKKHNVENPLPYPDKSFDYVHCRFMIFSLSEEIYIKLLKELVRVLKPGGHIEMKEISIEQVSERTGVYTKVLMDQLTVMLRSKGFNPLLGQALERHLTDSNVLFVQSSFCSIPIGWGPKPVGEYLQKNMVMLITSLKPRLMSSNGTTEAQFNELLEQCIKEWPESGSYLNFWTTLGQKSRME